VKPVPLRFVLITYHNQYVAVCVNHTTDDLNSHVLVNIRRFVVNEE